MRENRCPKYRSLNSFPIVLTVLIVSLVTLPVFSVEIRWYGDIDNNWGTVTAGNSNWVTSVGAEYGKRPQNGDILSFENRWDSLGISTVVDFTGLVVGGLKFDSSPVGFNTYVQAGYQTSGQSFTLSGNVTCVTAGGVDIRNNITLGTDSIWDIQDQYSIDTPFEVSGVISGSRRLIKQGEAGLTLNAVNTYTGGTTIEAGGIYLGINNALPSGRAVTLNGGDLHLGAYNQTVGDLVLGSAYSEIDGTTGTLTLNGNVTGLGNSKISGKLNLGGTTRQFAVSGGTLSIAAATAGTGGVTKTGLSTLSLSGTNTYTGSTTINEGCIRVSGGDAIPDTSAVVLANTGGVLFSVNGQTETIGSLEGGGETGGSVDVNDGTLIFGGNNLNKTFSGDINGLRSHLVKIGTGTQTFAGPTSFSGSLQINQGSVKVATNNVFENYHDQFSHNQVDVDIQTGASLNLNGYDVTIGTLNGDGNIALGSGDLTVNMTSSPTDSVFSGIISGTGRLIVDGPSYLTLTGANTYSGGTVIRRPHGLVGDTTSLKGNIAFESDVNYCSVTFNQASDGTYSGILSGNGGLIKNGPGTLTLSGANTFTGGQLRINQGTVRLAGGAALADTVTVDQTDACGTGLELGANEEIGMLTGGGGSIRGEVNLGSYFLTLGSDESFQYDGIITGTGGLIKKGAGTLTLTESATYSGGTTVLAGRLAGNHHSLQGNIQNSGTVEFNQADLGGTYSGVMSGPGDLIKTGTQTLILSGANTFTGQTHVMAGTLRLGIGDILSDSTTVWVDAGATLDLNDSGERFGALIGEGTVDLGSGDLGLATNEDSMFSGIIIGSGVLTKYGAGVMELRGANTYSGGTTVNLGTLVGNTTSLQGNIANKSAVVFNQSATGTYAGNVSGTGSLTKQGTGTLTLTGTNTYTGGTAITAGTLQIGNGGTSGSITGDVVNNGTLIVDRDGTLSLGGIISGSGKLAKDGPGTLILTGANTYTGGTTVFEGTLQGTTNSLQSNIANNGSVVFNQSATGTYGKAISGHGTVSKTGLGMLILTGTNTYDGGTAIQAGTLLIGNGGTTGSIVGDILNNANLMFYRSNTYTFGGIISGTGTVTQNGAGTVNLTTANTYSGGTTVTSGILGIGSDANLGATSGSLTLNGGTLKSTAAFEFSFARSTVLGADHGTFNTNGFDTTIPSVISGTGALNKTGLASLILTGDNTYSGGTTISQGTLQIGNGGTTGSITGDITNNAALVFSRSDACTFGGMISGTGSVTKAGAGSLTLTSENTYTGGTTITQGTLQIGNGATTGSILGNVTNNANLTFNRSNAYVFDGAISGNGSVTKTGAGVLTLTNGNTYTGGTTIGQGTLQIGSGGTTGSIAGDIADNATLVFNRSDDYTFGGTISGTGKVTQNGTGVLKLTGANTYSGGTTLNAGVVQVGANANLGASAGDVTFDAGTLQTTGSFTLSSDRSMILNSGGGTFDTNGFDLTVAGGMSGSGNLTKTGAGTLSLSAISARSGKTYLNQGAIQVTSIARLGATPINYVSDLVTFNGGTLKTTGTTSFSANRGITLAAGNGTFDVAESTTLSVYAPIVGAGGFTKTGLGTMTLGGVSTFAGLINVNQGTVKHSGNNRLPASARVNLSVGTTYDLTNYDQTLASLTGYGTVAIGTGNLTLNNTSDVLFSGIIDGVGGNLTKNGPGIVTLGGANTYSGLSAITQGTLRLGNANRLADMSNMSISAGACFDLNGYDETIGGLTGSGSVLLNGGTLTVGVNNGDSTFSGGVSGNGGLTKAGFGTFTINGTNAYTGLTTVHNGTLLVGSSTAVPSSSSVVLDSLATLKFSNAVGQEWSFGSTITGAGKFVKEGPGTLVLSGDARYSGETAINEGTLRINDTLQTAGEYIRIEQNATLEACGVIRRNLMGMGNLVLTDNLVAGSLTGGGVNLYGGSVHIGGYELAVLGRYPASIGGGTIEGGTLSSLHGVNVSGSFSGYGTVDGDFTNYGSVTGGSGYNVLAFHGPVSGPGSWAGNVEFYNILSPGMSPADVDFENMILTDSSLLKMELGDTGYDHLNFSGLGTLDGVLAVELIYGFTPMQGQTFNLFDGPMSGQFSAVNLPALAGGLTWDTSSLYADGSISVVPEPAGILMFLLTGGWMARRRK